MAVNANSRIAVNLKNLRSLKGLSQQAVAEGAGISRIQYCNIENGKSEPRVGTLQGIASFLDASMRELMAKPATLSNVRFRSSKTLSKKQVVQRDRIVSDVAVWLRHFSSLEEALNEHKDYLFHKGTRNRINKHTKDLAIKQAEAARNALELARDEPVRDICGLLVKAGVKVLTIESDLDKFFGLSVSEEHGGPAIVVNVRKDISVERRIFTAAHELGHLLLHPQQYSVGDSEEEKKDEADANLFGSYFLMPKEEFLKRWEEAAGLEFFKRVLHEKRLFRVSYATVLRRLADERLADPTKVYMYFKWEYKKRYGKSLSKAMEPTPLDSDGVLGSIAEVRRKDEPEELSDSDFVEDRLDLLVRQAIERDLVTVSKAAEILSLPLTEMKARIQSWDMDL